MARNYSNLASSRSEYARALPGTEGGFRGVDFSSSPHKVALYRLPDAQNMYRDYRSEEGGALETIPGFRCIKKLGGRINGLFRLDTANGTSYIVAHAGTKLYLCSEEQRDNGEWVEVVGSLADNTSTAFVYNGVMYVLDGHRYQKLKESDGRYELVSVMQNAYTPRTWYMGEQYEQRNMLTDRYTVSELGSGGMAASPVANQYDAEGRYVGGGAFVFADRNEFYAYKHSGIKTLVFSSEEEGTIKYGSDLIEQWNTSVENIYLLAKNQSMVIDADEIPFAALKNLYLNADVNGGCKIIFREGVFVMNNGGCLHFCESKRAWEEMFESPEGALSSLPPNIVLRQGTSITPADGDILGNYFYEEYPSMKFISENIAFGLPGVSHRDESRIYVHALDEVQGTPSTGKLTITVGANVPTGRYYVAGNVINDKGLFSYILYRIKVVSANTPDEDMPKAVQDVFEYSGVPMVFHLPEKTKEVLSVKDEDFDAAFGCFYDDDGNISAVGSIVRAGENEVKIEALATDYHVKSIGTNSTYLDANPDYNGTSEEAINGCTLCAIYDDRVFLSGNPALPNTVFYSSRNDVGVNDPSYFGVLNYFNDGVGGERVTALFPFSDTLCVAKKDNVFYHQGSDGTDYVTRVYPSVRGNAGLGSLGACCSFLDDPVMLTKEGVYGVNKETLTLERTLGRRSSTIDARLLREQNLDEARMVEWEGYLCLFVGGHVYMADSRAAYEDATGGMQYEWFYLCDVGVWRDEIGLATPVYAADTGELPIAGEKVTQDGTEYALTETHEEILFTDAYSAIVDGQSILYAIKDGKAYAVYETDELAKEGTFHPAVCPMVVGDRLYFGADTGEVFVFNNDKRGVSVNGDEVEESELHYSFYSFAGHSIDSGFLTRYDDCGVPHLCKSTSSRSLVLRVKLMSAALFTIGVSTERAEDRRVDEISASRFSFAGTDFSSLSFMVHTNATIVAGERERRWVAKQYLLRDGGFCRPFGVYSMTYRYRIAGRIR